MVRLLPELVPSQVPPPAAGDGARGRVVLRRLRMHAALTSLTMQSQLRDVVWAELHVGQFCPGRVLTLTNALPLTA